MRKELVAALALVAAVATVACGGDGEPDAAGTPSRAAGGPPVTLSGTVNDRGVKNATSGGEVEVELADFAFGPTFVQATPRATLALRLTNSGEVAHTFTVDGARADVTVKPGATGEASVTLPASGAVRFYCRFHEGQGMQGAFYFTPGDPVAPDGSGSGGSGGGTGNGSGSGSAPADSGDGAYGS